MKFTDSVKVGSVKVTDEGYLVATAKIARTGVQDYLASELGLMGDGIVRVNRPESAVFAKDALASLSRIPVTIDHPVEMVDADNWGDLAVGEVGDNIMRDGEFIVVNPMIKDAKGRKVAQTTHKELSAGYTAQLRAVEHDDYEYEMFDFKFNHLALVPRARAGHEARIGDSANNWGAAPQTKEDHTKMDMKTIVVGDVDVQVAATDADKLKAIMADHASIVADKDKEAAIKDAKIADLEAKVLDEDALTALIDAKAEMKAKRKAVEDAKGAEFMDGKSDAYIEAAFDMLDAAADDTARNALGDRKVPDADPWAAFNVKDAK